MITSRISFGVT